MNAAHFDRWSRALSRAALRRQLLLALLLGVANLHGMDGVDAGPGCKNVGKTCRKSKQCCSGVCKGKKGRKKCKAHDTGGCQAGQSEVRCGGDVNVPCTSANGEEGVCDTTTGNAGYCTVGAGCFPCTRDADCRDVCGPATACIRCAPECADEGGTACVGPSECPGLSD
jgi:hypothetical protein